MVQNCQLCHGKLRHYPHYYHAKLSGLNVRDWLCADCFKASGSPRRAYKYDSETDCAVLPERERGVELLKAFADWYDGAMPDPQGEITEVYTVARRVLESMGEI